MKVVNWREGDASGIEITPPFVGTSYRELNEHRLVRHSGKLFEIKARMWGMDDSVRLTLVEVPGDSVEVEDAPLSRLLDRDPRAASSYRVRKAADIQRKRGTTIRPQRVLEL